MRTRVGVLISGRGSNMVALVEASRQQDAGANGDILHRHLRGAAIGVERDAVIAFCRLETHVALLHVDGNALGVASMGGASTVDISVALRASKGWLRSVSSWV